MILVASLLCSKYAKGLVRGCWGMHLVDVGAGHQFSGEQSGRAQLCDDLGHVDVDVEAFVRRHKLPELLLAASLI